MTRPREGGETVAALRAAMETTGRSRLGRALTVFHLDSGDCGGCARELWAAWDSANALTAAGVRKTDRPADADVLLVTGPLCRSLRDAALLAHAAMADPKWVVAAGDCAIDGGVFKGCYAVEGGAGMALPVDLLIPGCPPSPSRIAAGLRAVLEANLPPGRRS